MNPFESAVLGCLFFDDKQSYVKPLLIEEKYFENKELLKKIITYRINNLPYDLIIANQYFNTNEIITLFDGIDIITHISNFEVYYQQLKLKKLEADIFSQIQKADINIETVKEYISIVNDKKTDIKLFNFHEDLLDYIDNYEKGLLGKIEKYTIKLEGFSEIMGYFNPKMFYTVGAKSGNGKTNLMLKFMGQMLSQNIPCLYFTSEMGYNQIVERFAAMNSDLRLFDISNYHLNKQDASEYVEILKKFLFDKDSRIVEGSKFDIVKIKECIDKTKAKFVFIDYIQKFNMVSPNKNLTRAAIVSDIANDLKGIAMDKNVVVICACQLKQSSDSSDAKLSDLKESGGIEEASDAIILLSRESEDNNFMKIKIDIAKNKYGITNKFIYIFDRKNCNMYYSKLDTEELKKPKIIIKNEEYTQAVN